MSTSPACRQAGSPPPQGIANLIDSILIEKKPFVKLQLLRSEPDVKVSDTTEAQQRGLSWQNKN
jgi:hypothetical protein